MGGPCWLSGDCEVVHCQEGPLVSHANAALTSRARLRVAQLVVDHGHPVSEVAARFQCSWPTVKRWADRYRAGQPMSDRSSRPRHCPHKTPDRVAARVVSLRMRLREGPVQLAARSGVAPSTVHRILSSAGLNRLAHVDRATGEPVRRYEHPHPGSLIHVDVKKLGNIPDGGGWRFVGRRQGARNRQGTPGKPRNKYGNELMKHAFVHTVIDDHSRVAYAEVHGRDRDHRDRGPGPGGQLVHQPRYQRPTSPVRQRGGLQVRSVGPDLRPARDHSEEDPPLPAPDQRQD